MSPGKRPGSTVKAAKPYGCSMSRTPIQTASSLTYVAARLPPSGRLPATSVMTLAVPSLKNDWLVVPDTPPPPSTMCTVPSPVSMSSVRVEAGWGVSVSLPPTTPRTASERS